MSRVHRIVETSSDVRRSICSECLIQRSTCHRFQATVNSFTRVAPMRRHRTVSSKQLVWDGKTIYSRTRRRDKVVPLHIKKALAAQRHRACSPTHSWKQLCSAAAHGHELAFALLKSSPCRISMSMRPQSPTSCQWKAVWFKGVSAWAGTVLNRREDTYACSTADKFFEKQS